MDRELGARREETPKKVEQAWQTYLKTVRDKTVKNRLKAAGSSPFRLNKVLIALGKLTEDIDFDPDDDNNLQEFFQVAKKFGRLKFKEDVDSRFGGEAVLTSKDLE